MPRTNGILIMTDLQKQNCEKLIAYLLSDKKLAKFDMWYFTQEDIKLVRDPNEMTTCGTVGCSAGHGPYAGIPKKKSETWFGYVHANFGFHYSSNIGQWCFSCDWALRDNSPYGAALRLKWFLEKGLPNDYWDQMHGDVGLCYSEQLYDVLISKNK
jgi:hypothetical protein